MTKSQWWYSAIIYTAMVTVILFVLTKGITCQPCMSESCHRSLRNNRLTKSLSTALIKLKRRDNKDSQMKMDSVKRKDMYSPPFKHRQYGKYPDRYHLAINNKTQQKTARRHNNTLINSSILFAMTMPFHWLRSSLPFNWIRPKSTPSSLTLPTIQESENEEKSIKNLTGQQDNPHKLSLNHFFFATRFNKQLWRKNATTPPSIDANTSLLQSFTPPMQIENNTMQNTTITSPTIQESENEEKSIENLAKKQQLQKHLIMEKNQYPIAIGRTIAFICNPSYCYEIDKNTGKKTYYICNQFYCYAMI